MYTQTKLSSAANCSAVLCATCSSGHGLQGTECLLQCASNNLLLHASSLKGFVSKLPRLRSDDFHEVYVTTSRLPQSTRQGPQAQTSVSFLLNCHASPVYNRRVCQA